MASQYLDGRAGPLEYVVITLLAHAVCLGAFAWWVGNGLSPSADEFAVTVSQWAFVILAPSSGLLWFTVMIRRLRDAGGNMAWAVPCCIPVIGYPFWVVVAFLPATTERP